jgi:pimeloyl-ACP methyl ester carboxylesterase
MPVPEELAALNRFAADPRRWAAIDVPVDLVIGAKSRDREPYGPAFDAVARRLTDPTVHVLPGQGHLAHVDAPEALGRLVTGIMVARARVSG